MLTDMNNPVYVTAFSIMIQEHLQLMVEGQHPRMYDTQGEYLTCEHCSRIRMLNDVGLLDDIIVFGIRQYSNCTVFRPGFFGHSDWWDFDTSAVNQEWLKKNVYSSRVTV